jgi:hypothetical protein
MFKGTYTDKFYRAIRDALHAEVESWQGNGQEVERATESAELWRLVKSLEPTSRNVNPTELPDVPRKNATRFFSPDALIPVQAVIAPGGDAND